MLEECNVSRAADRLFITQPAMSKTLSRLRDTFGDPLFTRTSHGMQPTPRAEEIGHSLPQLLDDVRRLLSGSNFDPAYFVGEMVFALSEHLGIWLLPRLMGRLAIRAPGLSVKSITRVEHPLQQLAEGQLDFSLHIKHAHYTNDFICHPLGGTAPILLAREAHPLTGLAPDWEQIQQYRMIRLYISDQEELQILQSHQGIAQRLSDQLELGGGFETSHLLTAIEVLRATDFVMPAPPYLLGNPTVAYKLQALPMPDDFDYRLDYMLVRHRRTENSAVHNWLWGQILEILEELRELVPTDTRA
jgi:DNA-binding transcriptional LysR family regulator